MGLPSRNILALLSLGVLLCLGLAPRPAHLSSIKPECTNGSYKKSENDCSKFYHCDHGKWVMKSCGTDTAFQEKYSVCDHSSNVIGCKQKENVECKYRLTPDLSKKFSIKTTWDGKSFDHAPFEITLSEDPCSSSGDLVIKVDAPFFNSPAPAGPAGQPFPKLWNYEVVEVFFLNAQNRYVEVELSPHGQHLVLLLNDTSNAVRLELPLKYTATILGNRWSGEATMPKSYLPPNVSLFNAFAIHGVDNTDEKRAYYALYPAMTKEDKKYPNFHRLHLFKPLDMTSILTSYKPHEISEDWKKWITS